MEAALLPSQPIEVEGIVRFKNIWAGFLIFGLRHCPDATQCPVGAEVLLANVAGGIGSTPSFRLPGRAFVGLRTRFEILFS